MYVCVFSPQVDGANWCLKCSFILICFNSFFVFFFSFHHNHRVEMHPLPRAVLFWMWGNEKTFQALIPGADYFLFHSEVTDRTWEQSDAENFCGSRLRQWFKSFRLNFFYFIFVTYKITFIMCILPACLTLWGKVVTKSQTNYDFKVSFVKQRLLIAILWDFCENWCLMCIKH